MLTSLLMLSGQCGGPDERGPRSGGAAPGRTRRAAVGLDGANSGWPRSSSAGRASPRPSRRMIAYGRGSCAIERVHAGTASTATAGLAGIESPSRSTTTASSPPPRDCPTRAQGRLQTACLSMVVPIMGSRSSGSSSTTVAAIGASCRPPHVPSTFRDESQIGWEMPACESTHAPGG
jgi:hypothetical protein